MAKILVSDPIANEGIEILKQAGQVDVKTGMSKEELIACIGDYDALAVRSETKVTADVLEAAKNLKIIGRAGVGVDNIDVPIATRKGVIVVNSPEGNTIAAAELTMALLLSLSRNIPQAWCSMRAGEWKRSKFVGTEVYKKTLGVVGLGKIGREVAKRAQGFGMSIVAYDPFLTADSAKKMGVELAELNDLLKKSDYITLHLPLNKDTKNLIGAKQLAMMKDGARVINVARGGIVDEVALAAAIESGKIGGAAIDVYEQEPTPPENPLLKIDKTVTTPHLGASTAEAQINVAIDIAEQIVDVLGGKPARSAVNMPAMSAEALAQVEPYLVLAERMGALLTQTTDSPISCLEITYCGELAGMETGPISRAALVGLLRPILGESVNFVNSPIIAESRGIQVVESRSQSSGDYTSLISISAKTEKGQREISGTLFGKKDIRIVEIDGYRIDVVPEGAMLVAPHIDKPGIIGHVGTLLGDKKINIAGMHVGRESVGKRAIMVLSVDAEIPDEVMAEIVKIDGIESAKQVQF
ncbi:MAG: phosphoglycerate dehydrogenase [Armatimonadota bacterium]|nr:phosphoglycerate dehydrogenase [Armatimonadota bacterium]